MGGINKYRKPRRVDTSNAPRRRCQLCKETFPMNEMEKIGPNQYLCLDLLDCCKRKLGKNES